MASPESAKPKVAIVGAGITGLLPAQGLQKVRPPVRPPVDRSPPCNRPETAKLITNMQTERV